MNRFLVSTAVTAALVLPALAAHAQTVTVAHNVCFDGSLTTSTESCASPASVVVGQVVELMGVYLAGGTAPTLTVSDSLGNTGTVEDKGTTLNGYEIFSVRFPITVAGADTFTINFSQNVGVFNVDVVQLAAPAGYTLAGVDFHNKTTSAVNNTVTLSGTATQANDFVISSLYANGQNSATLGTGQTLLDNTENTIDSWTQPTGTGTVSHTYTYGVAPSPRSGAIIGEKVTANPTVTQCGSSVTPAVSSGSYLLQCQLNGNLTINNPTGLSSTGKDSFMLQLIQPFVEPGTHYTVTLGNAYYQAQTPSPNVLTLSGTAGAVDEFYGVSWPALTNGPGQHVTIGAGLLNVGQ